MTCKNCKREFRGIPGHPSNIFARAEGYCLFICLVTDVGWTEALKRFKNYNEES